MPLNPLPLKKIHHVELLVGNAKQAAFYYRHAFVHFGFLNVFAAAVLTFSWNETTLTIPDIEESRAGSVLSYGSCSFDEPRNGLRDLLLIT